MKAMNTGTHCGGHVLAVPLTDDFEKGWPCKCGLRIDCNFAFASASTATATSSVFAFISNFVTMHLTEGQHIKSEQLRVMP